MKKGSRPLSLKQRELLARAARGEDRQIPESLHYTRAGRLDFVHPARHWYVPPGYLVVSGAAEYSASRVLAARGLLKHDMVPQSKENPYGLGAYRITPKGRKALV